MFQLGAAVQATTLTGVILQDTEPAATDRDKVWARTSAGAPTTPFMWIFFNGLWVAKHPIAAGTLWAMPYTGSVASIATLDGGAVGVVSDNSGPFWEAVTSLAARMPIGAGTLPSGLVLAVGDTGGEEKHVLTMAELPDEPLGPKAFRIPTGRFAFTADILAPAGGSQADPLTTDLNMDLQLGGSDAPHQNMPPYVTMTFLRRTGRIYCTQPIA